MDRLLAYEEMRVACYISIVVSGLEPRLERNSHRSDSLEHRKASSSELRMNIILDFAY